MSGELVARSSKQNNKRNMKATEEQIKAWKAKHGKVSEVKVKDGESVYYGYFHRPNMATMSAMIAESKRDEVKALEILFENTVIECDNEIRNDAVVKISAMTQLGEIMGGCVAELKNL